MDEVRTTHVFVGEQAIMAAAKLELYAVEIAREFECSIAESGIAITNHSERTPHA